MNINPKKKEILNPVNQLTLFGYENYFNIFIKLFKNNKLPNRVLLNGPKGIGKATFAYHFINYLLSYNEENSYSIETMSINSENKSYKNLCNNINPNFILLQSDLIGENIKIDKVRDVIKFINKSTYSSNIKIVLIDNAEFLNPHSANALLKVLEESNDRTFFFIIHNSASKILNTIKSRCIEFKLFFTPNQKKTIVEKILQSYDDVNLSLPVKDIIYDETPGNVLQYLFMFKDSNINFSDSKLDNIQYMIENYDSKNDKQFFNFISLLIELYYKDLSEKNTKNLNLYSFNKLKLLKQIKDTKIFNLDKKNMFTSVIGTLKNES